MTLTAIDIAALAIVLLSAIMAFARGFLRELFSIVAFVGACAAALFAFRMEPLRAQVETMIQPKLAADAALVLGTFIVTFAILTLLFGLVARTAHKSSEIGMIDRVVGFIFGAARGILILGIALLVVREVFPADRMPTQVTSARLYGPVTQVSDVLSSIWPKASEYIKQKSDEVGSAAGDAAKAASEAAVQAGVEAAAGSVGASAPASAPATGSEPKK